MIHSFASPGVFARSGSHARSRFRHNQKRRILPFAMHFCCGTQYSPCVQIQDGDPQNKPLDKILWVNIRTPVPIRYSSVYCYLSCVVLLVRVFRSEYRIHSKTPAAASRHRRHSIPKRRLSWRLIAHQGLSSVLSHGATKYYIRYELK